MQFRSPDVRRAESHVNRLKQKPRRTLPKSPLKSEQRWVNRWRKCIQLFTRENLHHRTHNETHRRTIE